MKIQHSTPVINTTGKAVENDGEAPARASVAPGNTEELQSAGAQKALRDSAGVDLAKVAELRDAIANGDLSLDPDVLAEAVAGMHRQ